MPLGGHLWKDTLEKVLLNICSRCHEEKPVTSFSKNLGKPNGLRDYCYTCYKYVRIKNLYGLSEEDHTKIYKSQKGLCAICLKKEKLDVDHCHKTKKVRGLLCRPCNLMLGKFNDDPKILRRAIRYLRRHQE